MPVHEEGGESTPNDPQPGGPQRRERPLLSPPTSAMAHRRGIGAESIPGLAPRPDLLGKARSLVSGVVSNDDDDYQGLVCSPSLREKYMGEARAGVAVIPSNYAPGGAAGATILSLSDSDSDEAAPGDAAGAPPVTRSPIAPLLTSHEETNPVFRRFTAPSRDRAPSQLQRAREEEEEILREAAGVSKPVGGAVIARRTPAASAPSDPEAPPVGTPDRRPPGVSAAAPESLGLHRFVSLSDQFRADKTGFLLRPVPRGETVQCTVVRRRGMLGTYPTFELFLDDSGRPDGASQGGATFLLSARKRKKSKSSYFLLSLSRDASRKDSESALAKLRGNYVGSEYTLYALGAIQVVSTESTKRAHSQGRNQHTRWGFPASPPSLPVGRRSQTLFLCVWADRFMSV